MNFLEFIGAKLEEVKNVIFPPQTQDTQNNVNAQNAFSEETFETIPIGDLYSPISNATYTIPPIDKNEILTSNASLTDNDIDASSAIQTIRDEIQEELNFYATSDNISTSQNINDVVQKKLDMQQKSDELMASWQKAQKSMGFLGNASNGIANLCDKIPFLGDLTSGSSETENKINSALEAAKSDDEITEEEYKEVEKLINNWKAAQDTGADIIADVAVGLTVAAGVALAPVTGGASLVLAIGAGSAIKVGLKATDAISAGRDYTLENAGYDAITGALDGALGVVTGGMGGAIARSAVAVGSKAVANQALSQGAKTAIQTTAKIGGKAGGNVIEGAFDGTVDNYTRVLLQGVYDKDLGTYRKATEEELLEAAKNGALGGALLSPLISVPSLVAKGKTTIKGDVEPSNTLEIISESGAESGVETPNTNAERKGLSGKLGKVENKEASGDLGNSHMDSLHTDSPRIDSTPLVKEISETSVASLLTKLDGKKLNLEDVENIKNAYLLELGLEPDIIKIEVDSQLTDLNGAAAFNPASGTISVRDISNTDDVKLNILAPVLRHELEHMLQYAKIYKSIGADEYEKMLKTQLSNLGEDTDITVNHEFFEKISKNVDTDDFDINSHLNAVYQAAEINALKQSDSSYDNFLGDYKYYTNTLETEAFGAQDVASGVLEGSEKTMPNINTLTQSGKNLENALDKFTSGKDILKSDVYDLALTKTIIERARKVNPQNSNVLLFDKIMSDPNSVSSLDTLYLSTFIAEYMQRIYQSSSPSIKASLYNEVANTINDNSDMLTKFLMGD